ncbi:MAG: helix-turn-helix domain-containing protein [Terriglobia bacterium]
MKDELEALIHQMVDRGILLDEALAEFEKRFIQRALDHHRGHQLRAARALGIHRNTLRRKLGLYQLDQKPRRR